MHVGRLLGSEVVELLLLSCHWQTGFQGREGLTLDLPLCLNGRHVPSRASVADSVPWNWVQGSEQGIRGQLGFSTICSVRVFLALWPSGKRARCAAENRENT